MFFSVGAVAEPLVTLFIVRLSGSWKAVFLLIILFYSFITVYLLKLDFGTKSDVVPKGTGPISVKLLREKIFLFFCISMFIYIGIEEGVAFWLNTYFDKLYASKQLGTYALSGYWASMIIGRYLAGRFYKYRRFFLKAGLISSLFFIIFGLLSNNSIISLICFIGTGLGFSAIWPILMSMTADNYSDNTGTALGVMMSFGAVGGIVMPLIFGVLANLVMIKIAFWIVPVMIIIIILLQKLIPEKA